MGNTAFLPIAPEVILLLGAVLVLMAEVTLKAGAGRGPGWPPFAGGGRCFSWLQWLKVDDLVPRGSQLFFSMDVPASTGCRWS